MITVTKKFEFEAAHRLPNYDGACCNLHGHTFKLEITVGKIGTVFFVPDNGMIMDFKILKEIVNDKIIKKYDHQYLNELFEEPPTSEILVLKILHILYDEIDWEKLEVELIRVRLYETTNSYCEWIKE